MTVLDQFLRCTSKEFVFPLNCNTLILSPEQVFSTWRFSLFQQVQYFASYPWLIMSSLMIFWEHIVVSNGEKTVSLGVQSLLMSEMLSFVIQSNWNTSMTNSSPRIRHPLVTNCYFDFYFYYEFVNREDAVLDGISDFDIGNFIRNICNKQIDNVFSPIVGKNNSWLK